MASPPRNPDLHRPERSEPAFLAQQVPVQIIGVMPPGAAFETFGLGPRVKCRPAPHPIGVVMVVDPFDGPAARVCGLPLLTSCR